MALVLLVVHLLALTATGHDISKPPGSVRFATFNASLNRPRRGDLVRVRSKAADPQAGAVAEVIQRVRPDVLLINEFDCDAGKLRPQARLH